MTLNTPHTTGTSPRRGLAMLIVLAIALGALLAGGAAYANDTTKDVIDNGQTVRFRTSDSSKKVNGNIVLKVRSSGNFSIDASATNKSLVIRRARWVCDVTLDGATVHLQTSRERVRKNRTIDLDASGHVVFFATNFDDVRDRAQADCDIVIG